MGLVKGLWHPGISFRIVSVYDLVHEQNAIVKFSKSASSVELPEQKIEVTINYARRLPVIPVTFENESGEAHFCDGSIPIEEKVFTAAPARVSKTSSTKPVLQRHREVGHFYQRGIKCDCDECARGKQIIKSHSKMRKGVHRSKKWLGRTAFDFKGPIEQKGWNGERWILS